MVVVSHSYLRQRGELTSRLYSVCALKRCSCNFLKSSFLRKIRFFLQKKKYYRLRGRCPTESKKHGKQEEEEEEEDMKEKEHVKLMTEMVHETLALCSRGGCGRGALLDWRYSVSLSRLYSVAAVLLLAEQ